MYRKKPVILKIMRSCKKVQRHVHEFEGSTQLAEEGDDRHNHRFAGVTGQTTLNDGHVHPFKFATLIQAPLV